MKVDFFFFGLCVRSGAEKLDHDVGFLLFFYFCLAGNGGVGSLFAISEWWDFWCYYIFVGLYLVMYGKWMIWLDLLRFLFQSRN